MSGVEPFVDVSTDGQIQIFKEATIAAVDAEKGKFKMNLDYEFNRLTKKKQIIDKEMVSKKRIDFLKENYQARYAVYVNLLMMLTVTLLLMVGLNALSNYYPDASMLFRGLSLVVVLVAVYFGYYDVQTLYLRDNIYFDELKLASPYDLSGNINYTVDSSNIFFPDLYAAAEYCDNDQNIFYDKSSGLCEKKENIKPDDIVASNQFLASGRSIFGNKDYANQGGGVEDPQFGADNPMNMTPTPTSTPTPTPTKQSFTTLDLAYRNGEVLLTVKKNGESEIVPYEDVKLSSFGF